MEEVIGHDKIISFFDKVIKNGKLSHAYCFVGPESVGKKLVAQKLVAQLLNTTTDKLATHADFVLVEQEYNEEEEKTSRDITVKQIRELRSFLSQSAYLGKSKVAILNGAEKMNLEATSALLKTLEEPNSNTVLFLITANEELLAGTIVSRTQTFYFSPVSTIILDEWLNQSNTNLNKEEMLRWSLGLPGKVKNWLNDPESFLNYKKEVQRFISLLGKTFSEKLRIVEDLFESEDNVLVRENWQTILSLWRLFLRDEQLQQNNLTNLAIHTKLPDLSNKQVLEIEEKIITAQNLLNKNINSHLLIENILLILP